MEYCVNGGTWHFTVHMRPTSTWTAPPWKMLRFKTGQNVPPVKTSQCVSVKKCQCYWSKCPRESKRPTNKNMPRPWSQRSMWAWPFKTSPFKMSPSRWSKRHFGPSCYWIVTTYLYILSTAAILNPFCQPLLWLVKPFQHAVRAWQTNRSAVT